jgi:hypothetical protein
MASNDYYAGFGNNQNQNRYDPHQDSSYHGSTPGRLDHDLPALPSPGISPMPSKASLPYGNPSPFHTPYDDDRNSYMAPNSSQQHLMRPDSYASSGVHDPFRDSQSIPLQSHPGYNQPHGKGDGSISPTMAMGNAEQFAGAPYDGDKERPSKKKGWFQGKIPYAVYFLSLVQIIVFIVEIIKNGKT